MEERKQIFQEFQHKFKKVCPSAPVVHLEKESSTTIKTSFGEYLKGSLLSYQLPSVDNIGNQTNIYGDLPFQLPVFSDEWNEHIHGFQNADLSFIALLPKDASQLKCDTREQSGSGGGNYTVERAKRITASQFGQVIQRKADGTETFLDKLFQGQPIQTPAMKYGLTNKIRAAKEYLDCGLSKKCFRVD